MLESETPETPLRLLCSKQRNTREQTFSLSQDAPALRLPTLLRM